MRSASLPWPTKVLISISDLLISNWMYWIPALFAVCVAAVVWYKTPSGRSVVDWLKLRLPVFGPMFAQLYTTRASRTLSTLLAAGVGVLDAIGICRDVTNNVHFDRLWSDMEENIRNGGAMSDAAFQSKYVPSYVCLLYTSDAADE